MDLAIRTNELCIASASCAPATTRYEPTDSCHTASIRLSEHHCLIISLSRHTLDIAAFKICSLVRQRLFSHTTATRCRTSSSVFFHTPPFTRIFIVSYRPHERLANVRATTSKVIRAQWLRAEEHTTFARRPRLRMVLLMVRFLQCLYYSIKCDSCNAETVRFFPSCKSRLHTYARTVSLVYKLPESQTYPASFNPELLRLDRIMFRET